MSRKWECDVTIIAEALRHPEALFDVADAIEEEIAREWDVRPDTGTGRVCI